MRRIQPMMLWMALLLLAPIARALAQPPIPSRVEALLQQMTTSEKIAQLYCLHMGNATSIAANFSDTSLGQVFIKQTTNFSSLESSLALRNQLQASLLASSRLRIPVSFVAESLHSGVWGGTLFPAPAAMANSWNETMVYQAYRTIAAEARAGGVDTSLAPVVNMFPDPRFGRYSEGFSQDPTVTARLGAQAVLGLQGSGRLAGGAESYLADFNSSVLSLAKHFAAYGVAAGGLNSGEATISNKTFLEVYLRPWRRMAFEGLRAMMISHQATLGVPMHANQWAIDRVMRSEFGFGQGIALTDQDNIQHLVPFGVADNASDAAALALTATVDLDLQAGDPSTFGYNYLAQALAEGLVSVSDLDAAVRRVLTAKFASGLMDAPITSTAGLSIIGSPEHVEQAVSAARESLVLVQNSNGVLPFNATLLAGKTVAVIGPLASCDTNTTTTLVRAAALRDPTPVICPQRAALLGPYALDTQRLSVPMFPDALQAALPSSATIVYAPGCGATPSQPGLDLIPAAVELASRADVVVLVLGELLSTCDEGVDRDDLDLPGGQLQLLAAVRNATRTPVITLLVNGRTNTFGPNNVGLTQTDALLVMSRPGMGGAIAAVDIILGNTNPSGRLAQSWVRNVGQIYSGAAPFLQNRNGEWAANARGTVFDADGRAYPNYVESPSTPLFYFGSGLSYTTFSLDVLTVSATPASQAPPFLNNATLIDASVRVTNTGSRAGSCVVQLYARDPSSRADRRGSRYLRFWKRLVAFAKVSLQPGQASMVALPVRADDLALYDDANNLAWSVLPGTYTISVGQASNLDSLNATIALAGGAMAPTSAWAN